MEQAIRRQLTLFLPESAAALVEQIRQQYDPHQHALIKAHLTLCREDEIADWDKVFETISNSKEPAIKLLFGPPTRFEQGRGLWLEALDPTPFNGLRKTVLQQVITEPRQQVPHITLMHPRESNCTDAIYQEICKHSFPTSIRFDQISLVEQMGGGKWEILQNFPLL